MTGRVTIDNWQALATSILLAFHRGRSYNDLEENQMEQTKVSWCSHLRCVSAPTFLYTAQTILITFMIIIMIFMIIVIFIMINIVIIRGGLNGIGAKKYMKANNAYLRDYDPEKPSTLGLFLDVVELYGRTMIKPKPTGGFKWVEKTLDEISQNFR